MKRKISILLALTLITLLLSGCGRANNPEAVIKEFMSEMYTVENYEKIDMKNLTIQYPEDKYTNALKKIATEGALEEFLATRIQLIYISSCYELHVNSEITPKNINKYATEKDGSIVYNYDGKVNLTFTDENNQKEEDINGQITVKKIDNNWTITKFNYVGDSIAKYYMKSKQ